METVIAREKTKFKKIMRGKKTVKWDKRKKWGKIYELK